MGLNSASGLMQFAHNRMAMLPQPQGCALPLRQQMRTNQPVPKLEPGIADILWETFQDNFEVAEVAAISDVLEMIGGECPEVVDMIDVYTIWGATSAEKKTFHRQLQCQSLGFVRDGLVKAQYGTSDAIFILVCLTAYMCTQAFVEVKLLQIVSGRWSRQIQLRRELAQLLDATWRCLRDFYHKSGAMSGTVLVTGEMRNEWLCLLCALPLMVLDYTKRTDSTVTASDASELGCGVCRSVVVTSAGKRFTRYVTMQPDAKPGGDLMLFEVFSGLGGLRQCLDLNGLEPSVYVTSETHSPAVRACVVQWPKCFQWGDAASIAKAKIKTLVPMCAEVRRILVGGGFPCSEYSALKWEKEGHEKDDRFSQVARIALMLQEQFPNADVKRFYECVASSEYEHRRGSVAYRGVQQGRLVG